MSACHVLVAPEYDVRVLTVDSDPNRVVEQRSLYEFMGITMDVFDAGFEDAICSDFGDHFKDFNLSSVYTYLRTKYGTDTLNFAEQTLRDHLRRFLRRNRGYTVLAPLGLGHPFNQFIHDVFRIRFRWLSTIATFPIRTLRVAVSKSQFSATTTKMC